MKGSLLRQEVSKKARKIVILRYHAYTSLVVWKTWLCWIAVPGVCCLNSLKTRYQAAKKFDTQAN